MDLMIFPAIISGMVSTSQAVRLNKSKKSFNVTDLVTAMPSCRHFFNALVTVLSENSIPVSVQIQNKKTSDFLPIEKGLSKNFYWISKACTKEDEDKIISEVNQIADQGFSIIVEGADASSKKRFLAVRIEKLIFGMEVQN